MAGPHVAVSPGGARIIKAGGGAGPGLTWRQVFVAGLCGECWTVAEQAALGFGGLLRQLRAEARLTQQELAEAAGLSPRSVSDLERGINHTAHKDTAKLLADALNLTEPARELFVAAARGR